MSDSNHLDHISQAITEQLAASDYFTEELTLMEITTSRIFRRLGTDEALELSDEAIEEQVLEELEPELAEAVAELEAACEGKDNVTAEIAKWREELAATG